MLSASLSAPTRPPWAAMGLDQLANDGQADTGATGGAGTGRIETIEPLEDHRKLERRDGQRLCPVMHLQGIEPFFFKIGHYQCRGIAVIFDDQDWSG